jgi:hypothetical protein
MKHTADDAYLEKAQQLNNEDAERLMSRIRGKLMRRLDDKKLSPIEAMAIQLEIEEKALAEWRERMTEIKKKNNK